MSADQMPPGMYYWISLGVLALGGVLWYQMRKLLECISTVQTGQATAAEKLNGLATSLSDVKHDLTTMQLEAARANELARLEFKEHALQIARIDKDLSVHIASYRRKHRSDLEDES